MGDIGESDQNALEGTKENINDTSNTLNTVSIIEDVKIIDENNDDVKRKFDVINNNEEQVNVDESAKVSKYTTGESKKHTSEELEKHTKEVPENYKAEESKIDTPLNNVNGGDTIKELGQFEEAIAKLSPDVVN